jgi:putative glycerol-1-phosphate prenyltransferase
LEHIIANWRHVFKLDPDKYIDTLALDTVCLSGTDAIMVGGSSGVTYENTEDLLNRLRKYDLPCALEVSNLESVVPGFDLYMVPMVLNSASTTWLIGQHVNGVEQFGFMIPWDKIISEGYIVLNQDCTAAKVSEAKTLLHSSEVCAYAQVAERLLHMPIVYLEYSGRFGDLDIVADVKRTLDETQLFYGGGITNAFQAQQVAELCDTVVVGNIIYSNLDAAISTVEAVKNSNR